MNKWNFTAVLTALIILLVPVTGYTESAGQTITAEQLAEYESEALYNDELAYKIAQAYLNGSQGLEKNVEKAIGWYKHLAKGYSKDKFRYHSAYILASLYSGQHGYVADPAQASQFFEIAAEGATEQELRDAPYQFARLTDDDALYIKHLEKSANLGYVPAMLELVAAYNAQQRTGPNDNALVKWLRRAAEQDHVGAQALLGHLYFEGDKVYQDYQRAYFYLIRAAEHRNVNAQAKVGLMYKLGLGTEVDLAKAKKWFELAYQGGNQVAGENLAGILIASEDEKATTRGIEILEQVASAGSKSAMQKLIQVYQLDSMAQQAPDKLQYWQQQFAKTANSTTEIIGLNRSEQGEQKVYTSASEAVRLHRQGWQFFEQKNYSQAIKLFKQAALLNLPVAQFDIALALLKEGEQQQDINYYVSAYAWTKVAVNNQQERADELLADIEEALDATLLHRALLEYRDLNRQLKEQ